MGTREVILFLFKGAIRGKIDQDMRAYCRNYTDCRRKVLMSCFPGNVQYPNGYLHLCCDICTKNCVCNCSCGHCVCSYRPQRMTCLTCCCCELKCKFTLNIPMSLNDKKSADDTDVEHEELRDDLQSCSDSDGA